LSSAPNNAAQQTLGRPICPRITKRILRQVDSTQPAHEIRFSIEPGCRILATIAEITMRETVEGDIEMIMNEAKTLLNDFERIGVLLRSSARSRIRGVAEEIRDRPFSTILVVFVGGLLLGRMVGMHR
jgi:hypothetical protein